MNIRKAIISDAPEIAMINVESWKTTYKGIISEDFLQNLSYKNSKVQWKERLEEKNEKYFTYVAESNSGIIVGFALGGLEQFDRESKGFKEDIIKVN